MVFFLGWVMVIGLIGELNLAMMTLKWFPCKVVVCLVIRKARCSVWKYPLSLEKSKGDLIG